MNLVAIAALVLGLTVAADANAASATCRKVDSGAVDRVCRWPMGKGEFVNVYYGPPSPQAPPEPIRYETNDAPPPTAPAYDDYGYVMPFVLGSHTVHRRDQHHRSRLLTVGRPPTFHGGFQGGATQGGGFRGHGMGGRRR